MAYNILLTMAGRGERFYKQGFKVPKPFIEIDGKASYLWSLASFDLSQANKIIIVALEEHISYRNISQEIVSIFGCVKPILVKVKQVTDGQACTALLAKEYINNKEALAIHNCDTYLCSQWMRQGLKTSSDIDGVMSVFSAKGDHWSFARTNEEGLVLEVAEKKRISPWATTGMYYFSKGSDFVFFAQEMIRNNDRTKNEFYIILVYQYMIKAGKKIKIDIAENVCCVGTPEELKSFLEKK